MGENDAVTIRSSFRQSPARMGLFVLGPVLLAAAQLLNAALTGLPLWAAGGFAAVMVSYAVLFARLHVSQLRLEALERPAAARDRSPSSSTQG